VLTLALGQRNASVSLPCIRPARPSLRGWRNQARLAKKSSGKGRWFEDRRLSCDKETRKADVDKKRAVTVPGLVAAVWSRFIQSVRGARGTRPTAAQEILPPPPWRVHASLHGVPQGVFGRDSY
jgi:hypothetical protein